MPCYDGRTHEDFMREEFTHNSPLAEMLCALMRQFEAGEIKEWPPGLWSWWDTHKRLDAIKAENEAHRLARMSADARASEAAPELLEVLVKLYKHGYTTGDDHAMVRDVIVRATGEQPKEW